MFAANDEMAFERLIFKGKNYAFLKTFSVGFDGIAAIQYSNPPLPWFVKPLDKLAELAANALFMKVIVIKLSKKHSMRIN